MPEPVPRARARGGMPATSDHRGDPCPSNKIEIVQPPKAILHSDVKMLLQRRGAPRRAADQQGKQRLALTPQAPDPQNDLGAVCQDKGGGARLAAGIGGLYAAVVVPGIVSSVLPANAGMVPSPPT